MCAEVLNSATNPPLIDYPEKSRISITIERTDRRVLDLLISRGVFASYSDAVKKLLRFYRITFEGLPGMKG